jgi:DNA-directed RNA polymerase subunit RPC12/RpoP
MVRKCVFCKEPGDYIQEWRMTICDPCFHKILKIIGIEARKLGKEIVEAVREVTGCR